MKLKNILSKLKNGFIAGVVLAVGIFVVKAVINGMTGVIEEDFFVSQVLFSGIMGAGFFSISIIFTIEKISLLYRTIIHAVVQIIFFLPLAYFANWIPIGYISVFIIILQYIFAYCIFWIGYQYYWSKKVKEINQNLLKK